MLTLERPQEKTHDPMADKRLYFQCVSWAARKTLAQLDAQIDALLDMIETGQADQFVKDQAAIYGHLARRRRRN